MALAFLSAVVRDDAYLQKTWTVTPVWRTYLAESLNKHFPSWKLYGEPYLSWIWVDTTSDAVGEKAVELAKAAGVPLRWGKPGYEMPSYIRIAVRESAPTDVLMTALLPLKKMIL